jgi:hypothetical protein
MSQFTEEERNLINDFILNNKPEKLPLIDLKSKKTIKKNFNKVHTNQAEYILFGSEGHYYSNIFCKINGNSYVLTYYFEDLIKYADYIPGYEE